MVPITHYILNDSQETPLGAQIAGFLTFIQSMRTRVIWGPKCTDMDTARAGRGGGESDLLEGLPALTWEHGNMLCLQLESSDSQRA